MRFTIAAAFIITTLLVSHASAQTAWDQFFDDTNISDSVCGVVNADNAQLVVLYDTAQLMIVTQNDTVLADTFVDADNNVFFENQPTGFVEFFDDGDGFRTLWWVALNGRVVTIDPFTAVPSATDFTPADFTDAPCDACEFVDLPPDGICDVVEPPDIPIIEINLCGTMGDEMSMSMIFFGVVGLRRMKKRKSQSPQ